MKKGIHPENYRPVVFKDMSNGDMFLSKSTCKTNDTVEFEGETYPVVKIEISSTSHPFYTGKSKARRHRRSCRPLHEPLRQVEEVIYLSNIFVCESAFQCSCICIGTHFLFIYTLILFIYEIYT